MAKAEYRLVTDADDVFAKLHRLLCNVPEYRRDEFRRRLGELFLAHVDHRIDNTMLAHSMNALFVESCRRIH